MMTCSHCNVAIFCDKTTGHFSVTEGVTSIPEELHVSFHIFLYKFRLSFVWHGGKESSRPYTLRKQMQKDKTESNKENILINSTTYAQHLVRHTANTISTTYCSNSLQIHKTTTEMFAEFTENC